MRLDFACCVRHRRGLQRAKMLRTVVNTLVAPQVEKFVFQHALKTTPEELLRGATPAANTISDELKNGRHDLQARKFVDATCQKSLMRDFAAQREARTPNAYDPNGSARLHNVRMIVGPDRAACAKAREMKA